MTKTSPTKTDLRAQAEAKLSKRKKSPAKDANADTLRLIHELEVHQIELEMQNEELVQARAESNTLHRQYADLYDFAPVGYFTLTRNGTIRMSNLTGASLLGVDRSKLVKRRFGVFVSVESRPALNDFLEKIFTTGNNEGCEIMLLKAGHESCWVRLDAICSEDRLECRVVMNDITVRNQAEEALIENELKYRTLFETAADAILLFTEGRWVDCNAGALRVFGCNREQIIGEHPIKFSPPMQPDGRSSEEESIKKINLAFAGEPQYFEWVHCRLDGTPFAAEVSLNRLDLGGKPNMLAIVRDVSERKQAEEALRESEERLTLAMEQSHLAYWEMDAATRTFTFNDRFYALYATTVEREGGYQMSEEVYAREFLPPNEPNIILDDVTQLLSGEVTEWVREHKIRRRDGEIRHIIVRVNVIRDANGKVIGTHGSNQDISEIRQAEQALRQNEERLRIAIKTVEVAVFNQDKELRYTWMYQPQLGYTTEQVIGRTDAELLPPHDALYIMDIKRRVIEHGQTIREQISVHTPQQTFVYDLIAAPIKNENGQITGLVGATLDITERKQIEEEIKQLNASLEQRVEERTRELRDAQEQLVRHEKLAVMGELAGSVGHELRNPLSVINSAVYYLTLVQPDATDKIKQYLGVIGQEVQNSEKIINNLLDFGRTISADLETVPVSKLIDQTLKKFTPPASVEVMLDLPDDLPKVYVDSRQTTQVFNNLVVNACQAMTATSGAGGKLTISAALQDDRVRVDIRDTGVGIPPENMHKIFDPLFTTKSKGIGLGLALSKKLIEANKGSIEVASEAGKGTTFTVFLPLHENNNAD